LSESATSLADSDSTLAASLNEVSDDIGNLKVRLDSGDSVIDIALDWAPAALKHLKTLSPQMQANSDVQAYCSET
jgi:hypothetical protein